MKLGFIYKITNLINNKIYIGETFQSIDLRFKQHITQNEPTNIHKAIIKYGAENFKIEQIYSSYDKDDINQKEKYYILFYNSRDNNIGYNICEGGEGTAGMVVKESTRLKMSEIKGIKVQNLNTGEVFKSMQSVDEYFSGKHTGGCNKAIINKTKYHGCWWAKITSCLSFEQRQDLIAQLEQEMQFRHLKGVEKRSKIQKSNPPMNRPVICIETQETFSTKLEANLKYNCDISKCLKNPLNYTANNYHWCDLQDIENIKYLNLLLQKNLFTMPRCKAILCVETGEMFKSADEAILKMSLPVNKSGIQNCATGKQKSSYGFHWKYVTNKDYINYMLKEN